MHSEDFLESEMTDVPNLHLESIVQCNSEVRYKVKYGECEQVRSEDSNGHDRRPAPGARRER